MTAPLIPAGCTCPDMPTHAGPTAWAAWHEACAECPATSDASAAWHRGQAEKWRTRARLRGVAS